MKAIKDCEWLVKIEGFWWASTVEPDGLNYNLMSRRSFTTKKSTKRNWKRFTELNKIKKWKYV